MSFIGALDYYTKFKDKLHVYLKPFYDLLHKKLQRIGLMNTKVFSKHLKQNLPSQIPNIRFFTVDASLIDLGAVLFQLND